MQLTNRFKNTLVMTILILFLSVISLSLQVKAFELQTEELEAFLDGVMSAQINEHRIPGAVISVVHEGEMLLAKGYGYAELEEEILVSPDTTLFRPGSVSKLITWTAVMQLVERGELDLDENINTYLDFAIPGEEPITMRNVMTHTAGFEDVGEGLFVLSEEEMLTLEDYLKTYLPARVFPAGEVMAYSNYATGLAGYIVELISGQSFPEYAEENIFMPLEMNNSTFRQPLPENMVGNMAGAYKYSGGKFHRGDFEYISNDAAGAMSTTAKDMANFMLAHLQSGSFNNERILQEETVRKMHRQHFTHHPELEGMALGFIRERINEEEVISHGGATMLFYSGLYLWPEYDLGLFVSYSGGSPMQMAKFFQSFMGRYFPAGTEDTLNEVAVAAGNQNHREAWLGEYHPTRSNFTGEEKLLGISQRAKVEMVEEGFLNLNILGDSYQLVEIEPGIYQNRYLQTSSLVNRVAFIAENKGNTLLTTGGPTGYQKIAWYESTMFLGLLSGLMGLLAAGIIINGVRKFVGRKFLGQQAGEDESNKISRAAEAVKIITSLTFIGLIIGILVIFSRIDPAYGVPDIIFGRVGTFAEAIFLLPYLLAGLIAAAVIFSLRSWWKKSWSLYRRISYSLFALVSLGFIWVLFYVNLL